MHTDLQPKLSVCFLQKQISNLKSDLEEDIGTEEIKKDVFNEMRMEELDLFDKSDKK